MTERGLPGVDGAPACPFVAFEDDRDERASSPDHRHRCYAEPDPAPRALAHQEAYCLSSAFPVCPTFQDWARREAARSRGEGLSRGDAAAAAASEPAQRNPPRNWAAPPPWMARGRSGDEELDDRWERDDGDADEERDLPPVAEEEPEEDEAPEAGRGLSGSYADRVATGAGAAMLTGEAAADHDVAPHAPGAAESDGPPDEPASAATRPRREREHERVAAYDEAAARPAPRQPTRPSRAERRDPNAPEWERARPMEAYPALRARRLPELSVPPILVSVIALALAAAVLFALPGLLGFGNPGSQASPTAAARPSATAAASLPPTPIPDPTQQVYVVQAGDTMSRIANRFDIPLDVLIAANEATIPNPDRLQIGDQVIIPVVQPSDVPGE